MFDHLETTAYLLGNGELLVPDPVLNIDGIQRRSQHVAQLSFCNVCIVRDDPAKG